MGNKHSNKMYFLLGDSYSESQRTVKQLAPSQLAHPEFLVNTFA